MRQDAAFTLTRQIKMHRANDAGELVSTGEGVLRDLIATLPDGFRAAKLDWRDLAEKGEVPQLYDWHQMLSGVSSHVTGLSVLRDVVNSGEKMLSLQARLHGLTNKMHLMMMAGATLQGSLIHAGMIENEQLAGQALELTHRMNVISADWP